MEECKSILTELF